MRVLEKLPEDSRIVIFLHYWRDIDIPRIAELMGLQIRKVDYIHKMTLQLLSKVFIQKLNEQRHQLKEVAA